MARQSRWQQFADNFNSVYGAFNTAAKNIESTRAMKKEYTGEDGTALTGSDLDRARYEALSNIYTKYGDAAGGLALRSNQAALESNTFNNDINSATRNEQTYLKGAGAVSDLNAGIASKNASASSMMANANRTNAMLPGELVGQGLGNQIAALGLDTDKLVQPYTVSQAKSAAETADAAARVATGTVGASIRTGNANANTAESNATIIGVDAGLAVDTQAATTEATLAKLKADAAKSKNETFSAETLARDNSVVADIMGQATTMDFGSTEAANSWVIDQLASADISPSARYQTAQTINQFGVEVLGSKAAELTQNATAAYKSNGLAGLADLYDSVKDGVNGYVERTKDGKVSILLDRGDGLVEEVASATGPNAEQIVANQAMEMFKDPMKAMSIVAESLKLQQQRADLGNIDARTGLAKAQTALVDEQVFSEMISRDADKARTELVRAQTAQTNQEIEVGKGGLGDAKKIALKGLADMLSDPNYMLLKDNNPELANQAQLDYMRAFGLLQQKPAASSTAPSGVDQATWDNMSDEDKALFK